MVAGDFVGGVGWCVEGSVVMLFGWSHNQRYGRWAGGEAFWTGGDVALLDLGAMGAGRAFGFCSVRPSAQPAITGCARGSDSCGGGPSWVPVPSGPLIEAVVNSCRWEGSRVQIRQHASPEQRTE